MRGSRQLWERTDSVYYDLFHSAMLRVRVRERQDLTVEPMGDRDVDITHTLVVKARTTSHSRVHASASNRMRLINGERTTDPEEARQTRSPTQRNPREKNVGNAGQDQV